MSEQAQGLARRQGSAARIRNRGVMGLLGSVEEIAPQK